jgi:hypothetical protein
MIYLNKKIESDNSLSITPLLKNLDSLFPKTDITHWGLPGKWPFVFLKNETTSTSSLA